MYMYIKVTQRLPELLYTFTYFFCRLAPHVPYKAKNASYSQVVA